MKSEVAMNKVKKIPARDYAKYVEIVAKAYPGFGINSDDDKKRMIGKFKKDLHDDKGLAPYGVYKNKALIGAIWLMDFKMNVHGQFLQNGGGSMLGVDLKFKKEHTAKDIMQFFIGHYRKRNFPLATLYPFRPDFYHKMGFGYGAKVNTYAIKPSDIPFKGEKKHLIDLAKKDINAMQACSDRFAKKRHGMFLRRPFEKKRFFRQKNHNVGFKRGRKIEGYINFTFREMKGTTLFRQNLFVNEIVWENREAFLELMTFLNSQSDQVNRIVWPTADDFLHFLPIDPRRIEDHIDFMEGHPSNLQGIGIMHRVINVEKFFEDMKKRDFGGRTVKVKLNIRDDFLPENDGVRYVDFVKGKASLKKSGKFEVEISLDIAEFSSVVLGAVDFKDLYAIGKADISDVKYLATVNRLFHSDNRPMTLTMF